MAGLFDGGMAIATVQTEFTHVLSVAERNRLNGRVADSGILRRSVVGGGGGHDAGEHHQKDDDLQRQTIGRFWEKMRHGPDGLLAFKPELERILVPRDSTNLGRELEGSPPRRMIDRRGRGLGHEFGREEGCCKKSTNSANEGLARMCLAHGL